MAMKFMKWLGSEFAGQTIINSIGKLAGFLVNNETVQRKTGDAIGQITNHFLRNNEEDEQLYLAACKTPPMTPELHAVLEARQHKFPAKHRLKMCDRFRRFVAQSKLEGNKETEDIQATAEVLALLAQTDAQTWKYIVDNLGLRNPLEAKTVLVLIKKKSTAFGQAVDARRRKFGKWTEDNLPTAKAHSRLARMRLNRYKRAQESNAATRQTHWWSLR